MSHLTEEYKLRVKNLAEKFTANTLGIEDPKGMCFTICYPLSIYLRINGINNSLRSGRFKDNVHYWLNLEDDEKTIVDPTINQFDKNKDSVLIEKESDDYKEPSKAYKNGKANTSLIINWLTGLGISDIPELGIFNIPEELMPNNIDIKRYLGINLKAAIIIKRENEKMNLKEDYIQRYLGFINRIILQNYELIEGLKSTLPEGIDILLSRAKSEKSINA